MKNVTVRLSADKVKGGRVSVKIRVTYGRCQKRFGLVGTGPIILTAMVYAKLISHSNTGSNRVSEEVRALFARIELHLKRAKEIINEMSSFAWDDFRKSYYDYGKPIEGNETKKEGRGMDMFQMLQLLYSEYEASKQPGTADLFSGASFSLGWFLSHPEYQITFNISDPLYLPFETITVEFLNKYEAFMLEFGKAPKKDGGQPRPASINTIGMYLRQVRIAYRRAMSKDCKYVDPELYPFGKGGYTIPSATKANQAVSAPELKKMARHKPEAHSMQQRSLDLWMFSYMGAGMNMFDICKLRWEDNVNLRSGTIRFFRKKTANTSRANLRQIETYLTPEMLETLNRWGTTYRKGAFVFPFLNDAMTPRQQREKVRQVIRQTNNDMGRIVEKLDLSEDIRTKFARHSFSMTMAEQAQAPILVISKLLGHASVQTTEHYLGQFSSKKVKQMLSTTRTAYEEDPE